MSLFEALNEYITHENSTMLQEADDPAIFAISQEAHDRFTFVVNTVLSPTVCLIGIIGNSFGLHVLSRDPNKKKITIYTYLFSLMMFDVLFLFVGLVFTTLDTIRFFDDGLGYYIYIYSETPKGYCHLALKHVMAALLIIMSAERLLSLAFPLKVKSFWLSSYPRVIITVAAIFSAVYTIPFVITFNPTVFKNENNQTVYVILVKPYLSGLFDTYTYINTIVLHYIAPLTVIVLNTLIVVIYSRNNKKSTSLRKSQDTFHQTKITIVVLCVAGMYVLLSLPNMFQHTLTFVDDRYNFFGKYHLTFEVFVRLGDFLARVNAAVDFYVYIFVSNHYRRLIFSIFRKYRFRFSYNIDMSKSISNNDCVSASTHHKF